MHIPHRCWISQPRSRTDLEQGVFSRRHVPPCTRLTSLSRVQGYLNGTSERDRDYGECIFDRFQRVFCKTRANLYSLSDDRQLILLKIHARILDLAVRLKNFREHLLRISY